MSAERIKAALSELLEEYRQLHDRPWIVAFSAGKDSTLLLQLVCEMLLSLPPSERRRPVHVVSNDTLVESPLLAAHMRLAMGKIERAADSLRLPLHVQITIPGGDRTFWVNVIGRGYRPPTREFRWCTDRLKIEPTKKFVQEHVAASGEVILLVGVRVDESQARAESIARHTVAGERLNPHSTMRGCMVYRPIKDFSTEEVWQTLLQRPPPWGGTHRDLVTLYRNAQSGECPLVIDRDQAPSCGSGSSRFGCWTCTVVDKDKSGQALAEAGFEEYEPLLAFRDWLAEIGPDRTRRQAERRNGLVKIGRGGKLVPGPFTLQARQEILDRLLALQTLIGRELISEDEINRCKRIWADDAISMLRRHLA